jgi:ABC-type antimicrobial peptide transport system permease subunit
MKIPLLLGREFTGDDRLGTHPVALVNRTFAVQYFGSMTRALGKQIFPQFDIDPPGKPVTNVARTIVGIVGDTRETHSLLPRPGVYVSINQFPHLPDYVLRTRGGDAGLANAVTAAVRAIDSSLPAPTVTPFSALLADDALTEHVETLLFASFAFLALALALAGVYAVIAYSVEQQTREFGIRRALGAHDSQVAAGVLSAAGRYAAAGVALGLVLAALAARFLNVLLFQTSPLDPATYAGAIVLVAACALLAALLPAIRAVRVNPVEALRYE